MRARYWIAILIAGILIGMSAYYYLTRLGQGDPAPAFNLPDISGTEYGLEQYRGKLVLLHFWASWCDTCASEMPLLQKTYEGLKDRGLVVLAVLEDKPPAGEALQAFTLHTPLSFPVLLDESAEVARRYGSYGVPETFVIDPDGIILERWTGPVEWTNPRVVAYLLSKLSHN